MKIQDTPDTCFVTLAHLSSIAPGVWINETIISFYCSILSLQYGASFYLMPQIKSPSMNLKNSRTKTCEKYVTQEIIDKFKIFVDSSSSTLLLPVNMDQNHWIGLLFQKEENNEFDLRIYDSLSSRNRISTLKDVAAAILKEVGVNASISVDTEPAQKDGSSCGVYVCQYFFSHLDNEVSFSDQIDIDRFRLKMLSDIIIRLNNAH